MSLQLKEVALSVGDLVVKAVEATPITNRGEASCPTCGEEVEELRYFTRAGWGKFNEFRKSWGLIMVEPCGHFVSRVSLKTTMPDFCVMDLDAAPEHYLYEWTHIASWEGGWPQQP